MVWLTWRSHNLIVLLLLMFSQPYRAPYMPPTQQYPVSSGTAGFYPGTSPAEYSAYGKGLFFCGAIFKMEKSLSNIRKPFFFFFLKSKHIFFSPYLFAHLFARKVMLGVLWFCLAGWYVKCLSGSKLCCMWWSASCMWSGLILLRPVFFLSAVSPALTGSMKWLGDQSFVLVWCVHT